MPETKEIDMAALFADEPSPTLIAAGQTYLACRDEVAELERQLQAAKRRLAMQESLLWTQMEAGGIKRLSAGKNLLAVHRTHYSVPAGSLDEPTLFGWLLMHGAAKMVKRWCDPRTFSKFCRNLASKGVSIHPKVQFVTLRHIRIEGQDDG